MNFNLGPKGKKNILVADGQTIKLPAGKNRKLYIVGSSTDGDTELGLNFGSTEARARLQAWDGYVGQWDTRQWGGVVPELTYDWHNPLVGLVPGFIKREPVAWYADHKRKSDGSNEIYEFCYLFRTSVNVPDSATEVTLANNPAAKIAALTVATNPNADVRPAQPLYDVLEHSEVDGPSIKVSEPIPGAEKIVEIEHPLYWSAETPLRYTLDGSVPTAQSPAYKRPFAIGTAATLTVAQVDSTGKASDVVKSSIELQDTTPATVTSATSLPASNIMKVEFSEEVDPASAQNPASYSVSPSVSVSSAQLSENGKSLTLTLSGQVPDNASLTVNGVKDLGGVARLVRSRSKRWSQLSAIGCLELHGNRQRISTRGRRKSSDRRRRLLDDQHVREDR